MPYLNSLESLFTVTRRIVRHYRHTGRGVLMISCRACPHKGGETEFQISLYGLLCHFCIPQSQVQQYADQREPRSSNLMQLDPFYSLEEGVLRVLQEGGFGSILLKFDRDKKGHTIVILEQTLSMRFIYK